MSTPLRVALIGLDHWYTAISLAQTFAAHPDVDLVAITDPDIGRARQVATQVGVDRVGDNAEDWLDNESVDLVASFTSTERNADICVRAANNGKHIVSIKPLARTLDQATDIVRAVKNSGVVFQGAETRPRYSAHQQQLRSWVTEGKFGKLLTASFSMWAPLPQQWPGDRNPGWFADAARAPGGAWIDHSIYHLDLLRWVTGSRVRKVEGTVGRLKYPDLAVEDYGTATVEFDNGMLATIEDTWTAPPGGSRTVMSLVGADSAVTHDTLTGRLSLAGVLQPFEGWAQVNPRAMRTEAVDELVATIRGERAPLATVEDSWDNLAACQAFYQAAASGTAVAPQQLTTA